MSHDTGSSFSPAPSATNSPLLTRGQSLQNVIQSQSTTTRQAKPRHRYTGLPGNKSLSSKSPFGQREYSDEGDLELGRSRTQDGRRRDRDSHVPQPPPSFPLSKGTVLAVERGREGFERRQSMAASVLMTPQMRSQRLIGNSNPRYKWEQYYKSEEDLQPLKKKVRQYYERNNYLIQQYIYIDRLLDSSLPHNLIQEYHQLEVDIPPVVQENGHSPDGRDESPQAPSTPNGTQHATKLKRNKDLYKVAVDEQTPLLPEDSTQESELFNKNLVPAFQPDDEEGSSERVVSIAIYINLAANTLLLILKIIVTVLTSSLSVLASLVDAALDFLSTFIVWTTTTLISRADGDTHNYPVGRRRLEPIGVLVFSVIMITSFFQVALEAIQRLSGPNHSIVQLSPSAIAIMGTTVIVKGLCWLWCRLINNSSVQALAQDAVTDVVFNTFSIIFPLCGYYLSIWWLDPLGGLLLSLYVILSWSLTTRTHILNLTGLAASKDERNILLYLTMRFARTIEGIQGLAAYHAGDKINVEVDIVLDEGMSLRDSHDLGESLQYVLESVPGVERAFVHSDYASKNLPSHMKQ